MADKWMDDLLTEGCWISDKYFELFGERHVIEFGTPMTQVETMRARIIRHYIEAMEKVLQK